MANPGLSLEQAQETVERVNDQLRQGFKPLNMSGSGKSAVNAAAEVAAKDGFCLTKAFYARLSAAKERFGLEPDWGLFRPARYSQPVPRAVISDAPPPRPMPPAGVGERVLAIGDLHQDPRHPHRLAVLTWMARYASEHRFDRIIQVGDWSTNDSVNNHDDNRSWAARTKPGIKDDLDNLIASHQAWRRGMASDYRPRQIGLMGNHENRLERFENFNPEAHGTFTHQRDETFLQFGWQTRPYGELYYCQNVAFTHHPTNGSGRAFGGETGPQRAANKSTVPVVSGHTHRRQVFDAAKIGPQEVISMVEIGCGLPTGEVESYAKHSLTGWWYGVVPMTVQDGQITDLNFVSMESLRKRYSDEGADIAA